MSVFASTQISGLFFFAVSPLVHRTSPVGGTGRVFTHVIEAKLQSVSRSTTRGARRDLDIVLPPHFVF
jgi:hypothetical protein